MTATRLAGDRLISRQRWPSRCGYIIGAFIALCLIYVVSAAPESSQQQVNSSSSSYSITSPASQQPQNLQSISKWLRLGSSQQRNGSAQAPNSATAPASGVAVEVSPPPSNMLFQYLPANRKPTQSQVLQPPRSQQQQQPQAAASTSHTLVATANRNTKLELTDQSSSPTNMLLDDDSDQFNLFVSNTCERDFMLVRVRTSRPFYGVIHTLNYRRKPRCSLEGDGALDYQLNISHALDSRDPAHCGVIKLRKQSEQGGEPGELLSVVLAIRVHRNVELSDDKFLVLNCTNRCRLFDCSSVGHPTNRQRQQLSQAQEESPIRQRNQQQLEKEFDVEVATSQDQTSWWARAAAKRAGGQQQRAPGENQAATNTNQNNNTCSVWRFPWLLALVCCLAILLIGAAISNCIFCLTLSARSPPTTKTKPTSDDIQTDDDRGQHNQRRKQSTQQKYINYDNSEYYRPVDVTYLQAKDGTRRARLENNRRSNNSSSNGSHQRSHTHSKSNLGAKTSPKR